MATVSAVVDRFLPSRIHQHHWRTLVKTVGYRALMLLVTMAVAFGVTNDVTSAIHIGFITNAIKTVTYYGYERFWARISWGVLRTG